MKSWWRSWKRRLPNSTNKISFNIWWTNKCSFFFWNRRRKSFEKNIIILTIEHTHTQPHRHTLAAQVHHYWTWTIKNWKKKLFFENLGCCTKKDSEFFVFLLISFQTCLKKNRFSDWDFVLFAFYSLHIWNKMCALVFVWILFRMNRNFSCQWIHTQTRTHTHTIHEKSAYTSTEH